MLRAAGLDPAGSLKIPMRRAKPAVSKISRVGITRYLQIYTLLARELAAGIFNPEEALLSEPKLVARYNVSRTTIRRALARLEQEGCIVRKRGSGTFVRRVARNIALLCPCCGQPVLPDLRRKRKPLKRSFK
jgi:DNA-binding transcriptional MocR family regulator